MICHILLNILWFRPSATVDMQSSNDSTNLFVISVNRRIRTQKLEHRRTVAIGALGGGGGGGEAPPPKDYKVEKSGKCST